MHIILSKLNRLEFRCKTSEIYTKLFYLFMNYTVSTIYEVHKNDQFCDATTPTTEKINNGSFV